MTLNRYIAIVARWWWLLLAVAFGSAGIAYVVTRSAAPVYEAKAALIVNQTSGPALSYNDALLNQTLAKTYSVVITQPVVLDKVAQTLGLARRPNVSANPEQDTQIIDVTSQNRSASLARDITNSVVSTFIEQQRPRLPAGQQDSALYVVQPAQLPVTPINHRWALNAGLAALGSVVAVFALLALLDYLDDTIKRPEDVERATALITLAEVMRVKKRQLRPSGGVVLTPPIKAGSHEPRPISETASQVRGSLAEAYRLARTNLQFASVDRPLRSMLVTSANPGEGKSTSVANLSITIAQANRRVIILDADLRRPAQHRLFGVSNAKGLTSALLSSSVDVDALLQQTSTPNLWVLPSGPLPPNPTDLLSSERMKAILDELKCCAELIVIDSPPVLAVPDAIVVSNQVDGIMLIVDAHHTRSGTFKRAYEALAPSGTKVVGVILNKQGRVSKSYYYYSYRAGVFPKS